MNIFNSIIEQNKLIIFFGMFGSGKTELAINAALKVKEKYEKVSLADIDTISPYFRSRDVKEQLQEKGIEVITPSERLMRADLPIIVPQVGGYIQNQAFKNILDAGGNDDGATVLGSLNNFIRNVSYAGLLVINKHRPFADDPEKIKKQIKSLTAKGRIRADYLVNNTNLADETDAQVVKNGEDYITELSEKTGIPVLCTVVEKGIEVETQYEKFIIKRFMKPHF
ncbi:MAG: hypothetical protein PWQ84_1928 [Thermotogaceae bacterium]|nr:hypothetical protein [Thermotogaceae bacterium]